MNNVEISFYRINGKDFSFKTKFTNEEKKWLETAVSKKTFTINEIKKTLKILLRGFTDEDFQKTREFQAAEILGDYFYKKAS